MKNKKLKQNIYLKITNMGIKILKTMFPEYLQEQPLNPTDRYIEYAFVIKNLPGMPKKVLDVGCSGGFFPLLLASFGHDTYGIDIRDYPILNKLKFQNFTFIKGDIRSSSFKNDYFDCITAISTIEHIGVFGRYGMDENFEGDLKSIEEIKRVLKPRGMLLLTFPCGKPKIIKPYMRVYGDDRLKRITKGFDIEEEEYYMQDDSNDWIQCLRKEALAQDAKPGWYPLCLLKLRKKT